MVKTHSRNIWLDIFRYLLAFMVVCIHFSREIGSFNIGYLCRIAVPFFFAISGFYLYSKDRDEELVKSKKAVKRNFIYLITALTISFVYELCLAFESAEKLKEFFIQIYDPNNLINFFIINKPPFGTAVLWFIIAFFVLSLFHYFMVKCKAKKVYKFLIPICLFIFILPNYYNLLVEPFVVSSYYVRNWVLIGIPAFGIGYYLRKITIDKQNNSWKYGAIWLILSLSFFALAYLEGMMIGVMDCYLSSIICVVFLILFFDFLDKRPRGEKIQKFENSLSNIFYKWIGVKGAFYIYIIHIMVGYTLQAWTTLEGILLSVIIYMISFAIYMVFHLIMMLIRYLKSKAEEKKLIQ